MTCFKLVLGESFFFEKPGRNATGSQADFHSLYSLQLELSCCLVTSLTFVVCIFFGSILR